MRVADRIAYDVTVTLIGFVFVASRIYVRYYVHRGSLRSTVPAYILSDVFIIASWIFAATAAGIDISTQVFKVQKIGEEKFMNEDPTKNLVWMVINQRLYLDWVELNFKNAYLILIVSWISLYFAKGSFLLFYWTTVRSLSRRLYQILITVTVITAISFLAIMGLLLFTCIPLSDQWTISPNSCLVRGTFSAFTTASIGAALHLSTHMALLLIGFLIVRSHITALGQWEWFAVAMLFGLGVMIFTAHCIRYAVQMSINAGNNMKNLFYNYGGSRLETWMLVSALAELHICLIAISLPTLKLWLHQRKQHSRIQSATSGRQQRKSAFFKGRERKISGMPRQPPAAMTFHLNTLTSMRSERGTMKRISTTETMDHKGMLYSQTDSERQLSSFGSRNGRDKVIRVYGATASADDEFERKGSVKIMNAEKF